MINIISTIIQVPQLGIFPSGNRERERERRQQKRVHEGAGGPTMAVACAEISICRRVQQLICHRTNELEL